MINNDFTNASKFPILSWRKVIINGIETAYIVSDKGFVMNDITGEFMLCENDKDGYPVVNLTVGDSKVLCKIHRLVANAFNKNDCPESKLEVDHINRHHWDLDKNNLEHVTGYEKS